MAENRGSRIGLTRMVLAAAMLLTGCASELPPIRQHGSWIVVENQTKSPWKDVSVTLNAY